MNSQDKPAIPIKNRDKEIILSYLSPEMIIDKDDQEGIEPFWDTTFDIVAIASSAGGVIALSELLGKLPHTFPCAVVVVQHLSPRYPSHLAEILERITQLPVKSAEEGEMICRQTIYIAPPNRHLSINSDKKFSLEDTKLVNFLRPSADVLFDSVAAIYRERAIAVVLTGTGRDGTMGVMAIHQRGGKVIVQDPQTAEFTAMPRNAIATGVADFVLPLSEIAKKLILLVTHKS